MEFQSFKVQCIKVTEYTNGRNAILLIDEDGDELCVGSVNIPDADIAPDEVAIKDYSENEGMLSFLMENAIVSAPVRQEQSGYVTIPICKLIA